MEIVAIHRASRKERIFQNTREMMETLNPVREFWQVYFRYSNGYCTEPLDI